MAAIGREIEATAGGVRGTISPAMTTCAAVEVAAFHGTSFLGNARLAKIENGHVPCVQMDQGTPASCAFSTTGGQQSGRGNPNFNFF